MLNKSYEVFTRCRISQAWIFCMLELCSSECDFAKIFLKHPIWVIYFLPTSPVKLTLGLQIGGRFTNRKLLGPIIMIDQSKTRSSNTQIIVIALFSGRWYALLCLALYEPQQTNCTELSKLYKSAGTKPFCWAKPTCFDFSSCNFNLQGITYWVEFAVKSAPHGSLLSIFSTSPGNCFVPPSSPPMNLKRWIVHTPGPVIVIDQWEIALFTGLKYVPSIFLLI